MDPIQSSAPRAPKGLAVALAVVLVAVTAVLLMSGGGDDGAAPGPPASSSAPPADVTAGDVCEEIPADLAVRTDSFQRTAEAVRADADALEAAGETETAEAAYALADTLAALAEANEAQEDTSELLGVMTEQLDALGC